jgi:hypothetical protein
VATESAPPELGFVLDSNDPKALAEFWTAALRYKQVAALDAYTVLVPDGRSGPTLLLQLVPEAKAGKNRMHFDLHTPDIESEASRLEELGARRLDEGPLEEYGHAWIRMADPEGNEFCVCDAAEG